MSRSRSDLNWERARKRVKLGRHVDLSYRRRPGSIYREDPLPERPMTPRPGITLPRVKWLERPMPDSEEEE